jgi:hypothetical protein
MAPCCEELLSLKGGCSKFMFEGIVPRTFQALKADMIADMTAETLSDYLYEYGENPSQRSDYSMYFNEYLVSACWKKLHRRFCSWQRLGLIWKFEERVDLLEAHLNLIADLGGPQNTFLD